MTDLTNLTDSQIRQIREKYRGNWSFLGDPDAEHDTHRQGWLDDLFIKAPEFSQAIEGKASLVIGRKGSGKSALRIAASERSRANVGPKRRLEITASADDLMAAHAPIIQALGGQASSQEGTVQTWQRTFIYLILRSLAKNYQAKRQPLEQMRQFANGPWRRVLSGWTGANGSSKLLKSPFHVSPKPLDDCPVIH